MAPNLHFFLISIIICFYGCKPENENNQSLRKIVRCEPYFNFDSIEHFYFERDNKILIELESKSNKSEAEKGLLNMMYEDQSKELSDTLKYQNLEKINFKKSIISKFNYQKIERIFCQREHKITLVSNCIPIYRDILIFKRNNKTVGVSKICFDCGMFLIIGTKKNTMSFGQSGDYDKLNNILHPQKRPSANSAFLKDGR